MPATLEIRRRIKSIRSTRQLTKAMELVAAAKMRKTQLAAVASRTYASLAWDLIKNLSDKVTPTLHPLLRRPKDAKTTGIVLMTSNRGLIGGFNAAIVQAALNYAAQQKHAEFICVGKKGQRIIHKLGRQIAAEFEKKDATTSVLEIRPIARLVTEDFIAGRYDRVALVYMDFVSTLRQKPHVRELLPLSFKPDPSLGRVGWLSEEEEKELLYQPEVLDYVFEPGPAEVLEVLLPRLVEMQIYQALLETNASEHSARMVAMKNASDAAADLVDELTLTYNQLRQGAITKEISEIVVGQLALTR